MTEGRKVPPGRRYVQTGRKSSHADSNKQYHKRQAYYGNSQWNSKPAGKHTHRSIPQPRVHQVTDSSSDSSGLTTQLSLHQPPNRFRPRGKRKDDKPSALLRAWIRIDPNGESSVVHTDKMTLASELGIQPRDLRLLESQLSNQASVILCRDRAIVINMAFVKTIITTDVCYVVSPDDEKSIQFMAELKARLQEPLRISKAANRLAGQGQAAPKVTLDWAALAQQALELPFELRVLEICLDELACDMDERATELESVAYPAVDAMAKQADRPNLDRVRRVKNRLIHLYKTTETFMEALEALLDNDKDMWEMNLGAKGAAKMMAEEADREAQQDQLLHKPLDAVQEDAVYEAGLPDTGLHGVGMPSLALSHHLPPLESVQEDEELLLHDRHGAHHQDEEEEHVLPHMNEQHYGDHDDHDTYGGYGATDSTSQPVNAPAEYDENSMYNTSNRGLYHEHGSGYHVSGSSPQMHDSHISHHHSYSQQGSHYQEHGDSNQQPQFNTTETIPLPTFIPETTHTSADNTRNASPHVTESGAVQLSVHAHADTASEVMQINGQATEGLSESAVAAHTPATNQRGMLSEPWLQFQAGLHMERSQEDRSGHGQGNHVSPFAMDCQSPFHDMMQQDWQTPAPVSQNAILSRLSRRSIAALSMRHGSSLASSSARSSVYDLEVAEVEMLLDAYFLHVNSVHRRLKTLNEYIEDTEEMVNSSLNAQRNRLLAYDLCFIGINTISMLVTGMTAVFTTNLYHPDDDFMSNPRTFIDISFACLAAYLLFGALLAYYMFTGVVQFT